MISYIHKYINRNINFHEENSAPISKDKAAFPRLITSYLIYFIGQ